MTPQEKAAQYAAAAREEQKAALERVRERAPDFAKMVDEFQRVFGPCRGRLWHWEGKR